MSEDLVNQLTLSFLISKKQLQKLNKRLKETTETTRMTDKELYNERIIKLFNDLLVDNPPTNLLQEVKTGFDFFLDKCIYYFKASDNNELLEKERTNINDEHSHDIIHDDIDYDKKVKATSKEEAITKVKKDAPRLARAFSAKLNESINEESLRSQLHSLVGNEMRLGKRVGMTGASHHAEEHKKAEKAVEDFLRMNPSMEEYRDEVEDHFTKLLFR